jgi:hypothetical protein
MSDADQIQTLSPEVRPLNELLQYQDGSIVSRLLLKNKAAPSGFSPLTWVKA